MFGNAQVTDTTRNVFGLAGRIEYIDSLAKVTMTRKPAVISQTEEEDGSIDTVYLGAERLVYYTVKKCDVDSMAMVDAQKRLEAIDVDPVGEYRKKAAEAAAKAAEEAAQNDPNYRAKNAAQAAKSAASESSEPKSPGSGAAPTSPGAAKPAMPGGNPGQGDLGSRRPSMAGAMKNSQRDSLSAQTDSLSMTADSLMVSDSLAVSDSLVVEEPKDTTKIGFLEAVKNVRIYKKNMQIVCDSLLYTDLDSLARLYVEPIIWQEITRQYSADSISVVVKGNGMEKASLMSNAFIHIQEDDTHYDQIKGTEMLAFFDDKGTLERFDVLGGASALFYIEENEALATVNKPESKMLSATFKDGNIQKIYYYDQAKNDAYPIVQLSSDDHHLKGFNWQSDKRPADRNAVTPLSLRPSERRKYSARPKATFTQTDIYFPGYMKDIYRQMVVRDSLKQVRERDRLREESRKKELARLDSLALADSLAKIDTLTLADTLAVSDITDSLTVNMSADSLALADSLSLPADVMAEADSVAVELTPEQIKAAEKAAAEAEKAAKKAAAQKAKAEKKAAAEAKKKAKQEALEAKWAELDKRDADKAAAKAAKKLAKERKRKRKALEDQAEQQRRDMETLERYRLKYEKQKARKALRSK
jgi:hypothetical protein